MRALLLIAALTFCAPAAADYYECIGGKTGRYWSGEPCQAGEKQTTYDSRTKQPKRDASSRPSIGMTADRARGLPSPWGKPDDINVTETARGRREQWVYEIGTDRAYLYIVDGTVTGIQAPDYMR